MNPHNRPVNLITTLSALAALLLTPGSAPATSDLLVSSSATHSVLRFDGSTGAFQGTFVPPGSGGLANPIGLVFGPDGNLYVSSAATLSVLRYHGLTGAFLDAFVAPGSGGLGSPHGLTFGPDGNLYVCSVSLAPGRVLRYDGVTGAFIDTFTPVDFSILFGPEGIAFGPDGNLYVSDHSLDRTVRFNGTTGAFLGVFAVGGNEHRQVAFGPDGELYVSSFQDDTVRRYDGGTGALVDFVSVPGAGVCDPPQIPCVGPMGLAFGLDGALYISTRMTDKVLRFDVSPSGITFLDEFVADDPSTPDIDEAGGLSIPRHVAFMPSAQAQITTLIEAVQQLVTVPQGTALTNTLNTAIQSLNQGNSKAARKQLGAFIKQVEALVNGNHLSAADGQTLIDAAKAIINQIQ